MKHSGKLYINKFYETWIYVFIYCFNGTAFWFGLFCLFFLDIHIYAHTSSRIWKTFFY